MRVRNPLAAGRGLVAGLLLLGAIGLAAWAREVASEEWPATAPAQNRPATAADPGLEDHPAGPPPGEVSLGAAGANRSDSARPAENVPSTAPWPPGIRAIKERGRLVVAIVDRERYPFFFSAADGNLAGSDVDMARDLARELGVEVAFDRSATTFDATVDLVAQRRADVAISKLSITLARASRVRFTRPYISLGQGLLINRLQLAATRQQHQDPTVVVNQPGRRLGVVSGTSYVPFARELFPKAELVQFATREDLFQAVQTGDVLAALYDENELKQYLFEKPERLIDVQVQMIPGAADRLAMAVAWDNEHLQYWLDTYLELRQIDWRLDDLLAKYPAPGSSGYPAPPTGSRPDRTSKHPAKPSGRLEL